MQQQQQQQQPVFPCIWIGKTPGHFFLEKKGQIMRIKYLTMLQDATDKNDTFSSFF